MIRKVNVSLKENPYQIIIGDQILSNLGRELKRLKLGTHAVIISNPNILKLHGLRLTKSLKSSGIGVELMTVAAGEKSKSAQIAFKLLEKIARNDVSKKVFIVAFGGGVVGDLAGFVAAIYKRGIPYVQIPTTLLAQVDSSVGGKVAIDLPVGKNLVGAFYQPKVVCSDVSLLKTLSTRQIKNGMAEVVKYGIISDQKFFHYIVKNIKKILSFDLTVLSEIVFRSSQIKTDVVLADEKETKGIRTILNFGHTIGHAIEAAAGYDYYLHGEAIALGMRVAAEISVQRKLLTVCEQDELNRVFTLLGLPEKITKVKIKDILNLMQHDKKFIAGKNRFVLAEKIGKVKVVENIPRDVIVSAIQRYM